MTRETTSASMLIPSDPTNQTVVSSSPVASTPGTSFRASQRRFSLYCGAALITLATVSQTHAQSAPKETPLSVVNALHAAFGQHHDRAVHQGHHLGNEYGGGGTFSAEAAASS